ncbi:MAG: hypothetical protein H6719_36925 [Sandaracinaceae bacterium]|nr:hypothetical protein [Sandaracinaceae bacterium]
MDVTHEAVHEALLELEPDEALDETLQAHLDGCEECRAFAAALEGVDSELAELPALAPDPALLERTLRAVEALPREVVREREPTGGTLGLFGAILGGLFSGIAALLGLLVAPFRGPSRKTWAIAIPALAAVGLVFVGGVGLFGVTNSEAPVATPASIPDRASQLVFEDTESTVDSTTVRGPVGADTLLPMGGRAEVAAADNGDGAGLAGDWVSRDAEGEGLDDSFFWRRSRGERGVVDLPRNGPTTTGAFEVDGRFGDVSGNTRGLALRGLVAPDGQRAEVFNGTDEEGDAEDRAQVHLPAQAQTQPRHAGYFDVGGEFDPPERPPAIDAPPPPPQNDEGRPVTRLPAPARPTEGLTFRSPTGYWANTYLPGDPAVRMLRRRLADDPAALRLAELAMPSEPSFDAPRSGALALAVEADRAGVEGRTRVTVSVGLRGAAQRAGRRPTLRTQVLLDLRRPLDEEGQGRVRALIDALARRHTGGDELGLLVAGPDGGTRIELGTMRFGEQTVALRRAFGPTPGDATPLSLRDALERSVESLGQVAEDAPLGSSMVLLVTPGLSDAESRDLESVAHLGALAGVGTTVVGLSADIALEPMERVALAGQGRRRRLERAADADDLARDEITAVSRVIARAVRLRVRLAEGVQLVDVLGSRSLDELQAQRVREAERAIDRALAARLGIASDRGEDEDGIQIVVPAFYADDTHRVLLDLVVPGPGPVADVQVRFKDLVRLGNGTLTERLVLARGGADRGPAQRAVHAAALGYRVSLALREAAAHLDAGDAASASATLEAARASLEAETRALPELASEPALARDLSLFRRYVAELQARPTSGLAGSLRYAAHRRLLGDPLGLGGEP